MVAVFHFFLMHVVVVLAVVCVVMVVVIPHAAGALVLPLIAINEKIM